MFRHIDFVEIHWIPHFTGAEHRINCRQNHSGNGDNCPFLASALGDALIFQCIVRICLVLYCCMSDLYPKAVDSLREPEVEPSPEVKQFLHEAAIRGSVDAVYGVGKQYLKTDIQKAIAMFELAAEQGNSYAEYQLGKIYCFGQGIPQNLEIGMEWLRASAGHGNEYAAALLEKVQNHIHQQTTSAVLGLFRGLAGMIQASANQNIRRRDSIDRKQRQKIEEKKQAHGQQSSGYDYDYSEDQTM